MLREDLGPSIEAHSRRWELVVNAYPRELDRGQALGRDLAALDHETPRGLVGVVVDQDLGRPGAVGHVHQAADAGERAIADGDIILAVITAEDVEIATGRVDIDRIGA